VPCTVSIQKHFGSYRGLYDRLGYRLEQEFIHKRAQSERSLRLRKEIADSISVLFPDHVAVTERQSGNHWTRVLLRIDDRYFVSLLLCRMQHGEGKLYWKWEAKSAKSTNVTLLCKINESHVTNVTSQFLTDTLAAHPTEHY
jgi:hypothetical protein